MSSSSSSSSSSTSTSSSSSSSSSSSFFYDGADSHTTQSHFKIYLQDPNYRRQYFYTERETFDYGSIFFVDVRSILGENKGLFYRDDIYWIETNLENISLQACVGEMSCSSVSIILNKIEHGGVYVITDRIIEYPQM